MVRMVRPASRSCIHATGWKTNQMSIVIWFGYDRDSTWSRWIPLTGNDWLHQGWSKSWELCIGQANRAMHHEHDDQSRPFQSTISWTLSIEPPWFNSRPQYYSLQNRILQAIKFVHIVHSTFRAPDCIQPGQVHCAAALRLVVVVWLWGLTSYSAKRILWPWPASLTTIERDASRDWCDHDSQCCCAEAKWSAKVYSLSSSHSLLSMFQVYYATHLFTIRSLSLAHTHTVPGLLSVWIQRETKLADNASWCTICPTTTALARVSQHPVRQSIV